MARKINPLHLLIDLAIIVTSLYASVFLRLQWDDFLGILPVVHRNLPLFICLRLLCLMGFGVYNFIWRYFSARDAVNLSRAIFFSSLLVFTATAMIDIGHLPRSVFAIDTLLLAILMSGARLAVRLHFEKLSGKPNGENARRTLIYGAGTRGLAFLQQFSNGHGVYNFLGFIDDDPKKVGYDVSGMPVLGTRKELAKIIENYSVRQVFVAISQPRPDVLKEVVEITHRYRVQVKILSEFEDVLDPQKHVQTTRLVELRDLLNRPESRINLESVRNMVKNKKVLITGAGGSIGSELARQILTYGPAQLLLLDHSEYNLYQIDQELSLKGNGPESVVPLLVDLKTSKILRTALTRYSPQVVFHTAAYKHVHLVEGNPFPSILNNVMGTKNLLNICEELDVESFVLISTDKAVNPVGIMGATKRICEILVGASATRTGKRYCAVRFGNVLGSSGSLIPLLTSQIQNGGPVTITHPDMKRFFMLIPEAVSLVLQAATISNPGDINILKMGEPVKIVDIAKNMIALMGKTEKEIPIIFTGLRPGEKLFEELYLSGTEIQTEHPDIMVLPRMALSRSSATEQILRLENSIEQLIEFAQAGKDEAVLTLNQILKANSPDGAVKTSAVLSA